MIGPEEAHVRWELVIGVVAGLTLVWLTLVAALYAVARRSGDPTSWRELLRLLPDVLRLVRRLAADPSLPRGVRLRLWLLLGYLAIPLDLVPDVVPLVGYADDAVVVALVLRSVVCAAGREALERHWPGTPQGLAALERLALTPRRRRRTPPAPPRPPAAG